MGIERGHYSAPGGYRAARDYGPRSGGSYNYDKYDKYDSYGNASLSGKHERDYDSGSKFNEGRETTEQAILGLEKQIVNVKRDMNQAIQEATTKDNEKFDLIFSILTELQRRQAIMEESVRGLQQMFGPDGQRVSQGAASSSMVQFPKPSMDGSSMPMPPMPMGGQGFMMASGPQMGQQFMAPDGTPMQVVVMSPSQAGQMYGMPQMMPGPMPVPLAAGQFDANGVVCDFNNSQPTGEQPTGSGGVQEAEGEQQQSQNADAAAAVQVDSDMAAAKLVGGETAEEAQKGGEPSRGKAPHLCVEEE